MDEKILGQYAELKNQIKKLTEQAKAIEPEVVAQLEGAGVDQINSKTLGTFSLQARKYWKYSPEVDELENKVEALKSAEELNGKATAEVRKSLRFDAVKK